MFRWAEQSSGRFQTLDPEDYKRSKPMSERNYETEYWEAQEHIDKLEGDNATLKRENYVLREAFDAMHKHRYDSECEQCNEIVALLTAGKQ